MMDVAAVVVVSAWPMIVPPMISIMLPDAEYIIIVIIAMTWLSI